MHLDHEKRILSISLLCDFPQDSPPFLPLMGTEFNISCMLTLAALDHWSAILSMPASQCHICIPRSLGRSKSICWEHLKPGGQYKANVLSPSLWYTASTASQSQSTFKILLKTVLGTTVSFRDGQKLFIVKAPVWWGFILHRPAYVLAFSCMVPCSVSHLLKWLLSCSWICTPMAGNYPSSCQPLLIFWNLRAVTWQLHFPFSAGSWGSRAQCGSSLAHEARLCLFYDTHDITTVS